MAALFDSWVDSYDQWFETPIGRVIRKVESDLVLCMLRPLAGEIVLDAGCGTGIFTADVTPAGVRTVGIELSLPMLMAAGRRLAHRPFLMVRGDMITLPFRENVFDKAFSVTALEFIRQGKEAVRELFRVVKPGGMVMAATLNSLSPWAAERKNKAEKGQSLFI
jgi:ubiquinone/menaquinone biosynthesis C-methylase UbiE